ncbi:MAG: VCBS repeat-containing protein [Chitinophagaceae bacterium]|nr:VCBS repeat-containing protein [Chitinophagaceae bacterium]
MTRLNIAIPGGRNIVLADLDGDKKPDLIVPDAVNNSSAILKNNSTKGVFSFGNPLNLTGFTHSYMDYGDFDGDGKADIVSGDLNGSQIAVYRNTSSGGTGSVWPQQLHFHPLQATPAEVAVSDLDGDGKPDIAVVLGNYNLGSVQKNTSSTGNISFV